MCERGCVGVRDGNAWVGERGCLGARERIRGSGGGDAQVVGK